jgi:hypothetical protein
VPVVTIVVRSPPTVNVGSGAGSRESSDPEAEEVYRIDVVPIGRAQAL